ncbi:MATE family efflux transporter [Acidaminococcus intestini]|nr:MATE family efflux transporter [Acidaminococcus intestini]
MQNKQDKRTEKFHEMLEAPVDRLILKLAIPSILSMLTTSFYNMADTFFVSKLDTSSTAAVGVTFASMSIIQALGFSLARDREPTWPENWELSESKMHAPWQVRASFMLLFAVSFFCSLGISMRGTLPS